MKVTNIHKRIIHQPKDEVAHVFNTLASDDDRFWPTEKWPPMIFKQGKVEGAVGGHGPIRYSIQRYEPGNYIEFKFIKPDGFLGVHTFLLSELEPGKTEIQHKIEMKLAGKGVLTWYLAVKWLHDALLEDCLDKIESYFIQGEKTTQWNLWVSILREILKRKNT